MANNLNDFLKGLDSKSLAEGIKKFQQYAKTDEGKKVINNIKEGKNLKGNEKKEIMNILKDNPELLQQLNELL